jgi:peptide-methionine (R)-S-oxide reductase
LNRRKFFSWIPLLTLYGLGIPAGQGKETAANVNEILKIQKRWRLFSPEHLKLTKASPKISRNKNEWKSLLTQDEYEILFEEQTERPYSSPFNDEQREGLYVCRACNLPLFSSEMKFDSGTGWPSFYTTIPGHLETKADYKLIWPRTEYHCVKCGGHQGHVFDDGPKPTMERWCNNGLSLNFIGHQF